MEVGEQPVDESEAVARRDETDSVSPLKGTSFPSASVAISSKRNEVVPTATMLPPLAFTAFSAWR